MTAIPKRSELDIVLGGSSTSHDFSLYIARTKSRSIDLEWLFGALCSDFLLSLVLFLLEPALPTCLGLVALFLGLLNVLLEFGHAAVAHNWTFLYLFFLFLICVHKERIQLGHVFVFAKDFIISVDASNLVVALTFSIS